MMVLEMFLSWIAPVVITWGVCTIMYRRPRRAARYVTTNDNPDWNLTPIVHWVCHSSGRMMVGSPEAKASWQTAEAEYEKYKAEQARSLETDSS